jgi:hypothetical protein
MDKLDYSSHLRFRVVQLCVNKILLKARKRIIKDLISVLNSDYLINSKILDFGINPSDIGIYNNPLLMYFREEGIGFEKYFCGGLDQPELGFTLKDHYVRIPKINLTAKLPFRDNEFELVFSNAVLEHIPVHLHKTTIMELLRISNKVFISVPNRFFPLEHHTLYPLIHFVPYFFRKFLPKNDFFKSPDNLNFISRLYLNRITKELQLSRVNIRYTGLRAIPNIFSSNIYVYIEKNTATDSIKS